jgi:hypothetical protein
VAIPTEGAGPGSGRDGPPKTRLDGWAFSVKAQTVRRFVTLGPRRGGRARRGGQWVGGGPPGGVWGTACAIPTEGAGPGSGRDGRCDGRFNRTPREVRW